MLPISYDKISEKNGSNDIDLFICCTSFEERCHKFSEEFFKLGIAVRKKLICYNSNEFESAVSNVAKLKRIVGRAGCSTAVMHTDKPAANTELLNKKINSLLQTDEIKNVLIDISTFTHESLLIVIRILSFHKSKFQKVYLAYVGATAYSTDKPDKEKWLSSGISQIRSVIGYPGFSSPARKNHLVILFGFESERTKLLIESMEFDSISLGFGAVDDSIATEFQEMNCDRHRELMNYYKNAESFTFSLTDPIIAKKQIGDIIKSKGDFNTVLAPMNNKISTVGAALVAIENPRVQLIYAKPVEYNSKGYSLPRQDCFFLEIDKSLL